MGGRGLDLQVQENILSGGFYSGHPKTLFDKTKGITFTIFPLILLYYKSMLPCSSYLLLSMTNDLCVI